MLQFRHFLEWLTFYRIGWVEFYRYKKSKSKIQIFWKTTFWTKIQLLTLCVTMNYYIRLSKTEAFLILLCSLVQLFSSRLFFTVNAKLSRSFSRVLHESYTRRKEFCKSSKKISASDFSLSFYTERYGHQNHLLCLCIFRQSWSKPTYSSVQRKINHLGFGSQYQNSH